jgi:hypothetical protein
MFSIRRVQHPAAWAFSQFNFGVDGADFPKSGQQNLFTMAQG